MCMTVLERLEEEEMQENDNEEPIREELYGKDNIQYEQALATACSHNLSEMAKCETTTVSQLMRAISKLFASHGDSGDYNLNEYEALVAFVAKENVARVAKGAEPWVLENLPSYKKNAHHVELAEAIVRNRPIYLAYLSTVRVCSNENKLVQVVWEVLSQLPVRL